MTAAIRHTCEGYDFPVYFTVYYLILTQWGIKVIWFVFVITVFPTYRYVSVYGAETCAFASAKRQRATGLLEMAISSPFSLLGHQTNTAYILAISKPTPICEVAFKSTVKSDLIYKDRPTPLQERVYTYLGFFSTYDYLEKKNFRKSCSDKNRW